MAEHRWKFARVGGFDQVEIKTGADLVRLGSLDQKLWVALACPTKGLEFDARTLELLDTDKDGRIRASELIAAVEWAGKMVEDVETLAKGASSITIDAIDGSSDEGKLLRQTAKAVLKSLGRADAKEIGVADMTDALGAFHKQSFNGDGIVPPESATDADTQKAITDILACTTPQTDKSGKPGVTVETTDAFFDAIKAHAEWLEKGASDETVRPFGDSTNDAHAAFVAVRGKIDDYFARCRIAAFDPRALNAVNRDEEEYVALGAKEFDRSASDLSAFPIAQVTADKPLPLTAGINPAWADALATFATKVVTPLLGGAKTAITAAEWATIRGKFEAFEKWMAAKEGATVEKLGAPRVKELAASGQKAKVHALLDEEKAAEPLAKAIESVERLVRYNRDLMSLANNFVSFRDFYSRAKPATFQIGTLYVDTRACDLCVRVNDAGRHATMAPRANTCLVYCDCKNSKGETMTIAAAMTAGDVDNLMVGRNGLFYDRKGVDWDATITSIVDNPISIRQAFWSPYKKALRVIEETIARRAAAAAAASDTRVSGHAQTATDAVTGVAVDPHAAAAAASAPAPAPAAAPAAGPKPFDLGTIAAIGVAVGGISAAFGALLAAFFGLGRWMPVGVIGLLLAISGPSMAIAWLKLRKRNLGPILDANGWAVNAQAMINVPLGGSLTRLAALPPGSSRNLVDPYAEKSPPWGVYATGAAVAAIAVFWYLGKFDGMLPPAARASRLNGVDSPAAVRPAPGRPPVAQAGTTPRP